MGLDPCRGSGVGAWSGVLLGQALLLLTGMLTPGASSSHCTAVVRVVDPWGLAGPQYRARGGGGVTLGIPTASSSGGRTARVKSCPCQLIHLRHSQAGPGGSAGFGSSKWGWRRMQF